METLPAPCQPHGGGVLSVWATSAPRTAPGTWQTVTGPLAEGMRGRAIRRDTERRGCRGDRERRQTGRGVPGAARGRRRPWPWSRGPRTAGGDAERAVRCRSASQAPREGAVGVGLAGPRTRAWPQPRTPQSSRAAQGLGLASGREAGGVCKASPGHTHPKAT